MLDFSFYSWYNKYNERLRGNYTIKKEEKALVVILFIIFVLGVPAVIINVRHDMLNDPKHPRYGDNDAHRENSSLGCMLMFIFFIIFSYLLYVAAQAFGAI